ncbi:AgmX/PglI C-terminal domain-containing protein [Teredinibacter waterburyi]|uniref:AgmX/PglI C-terminal domain-containing protein n=1 Tax=Teredinibacter waterburyi TaxID=1500538 RepID=UPI00166001E3|nr:AgmX/PglI C-terminal domain-containing protein [Teredinibacter waterburyi]
MNAVLTNVPLQPLALDLELPWSSNSDQDEKFVRTLKRFLFPLLFFLVLIPWLPVFELSYNERETDQVVTTVVLKPIEVSPPLPEEPLVQTKTVPVAKEVLDQPRPSPKLAQTKEQKVKPKQDSENAMAQSQGLNELSSQLSALTGSVDVARLQKRNVTSSTQGSVQNNSREFLGKDGAVRRSDGIEVDENLVVSSSAGLAEYTSTSVDGLGLGNAPESTLASYGSSQQGTRDMESIRRTMERTKSNVYALYQQALLQHPDLAGKFSFRLVIEPDGSISKLSLTASELGLKDLENKILERIRSVNFGAKDVSATFIDYTFVFLPS